MKQKLFMMLGLGTMLLTACNQNELQEITEATNAEMKVSGTIEGIAQTRVANTLWDANDAIGIYCEDLIENAKYVTDGDGLFTPTGDTYYFKDTDSHHFTAYYPYQVSTSSMFVSVKNSAANTEGQKSNDLLFGEGDANGKSPHLKLSFKRCMARIILNVKVSTEEGFMADDIFGTATGSAITNSTGQIYQLIAQADFDTKTGTVTPYVTKSNLDMSGATDDADTHIRQYMLIVPEQQACKYKHIFNKDAKGEISFITDLGTNTWKAGYSYTYNITIKKTGMTVESESIEEWHDVDSEDKVANMAS